MKKRRRKTDRKLSARDLVPLVTVGWLAFYFIQSFQKKPAQPPGPGYDSSGGPTYG